MFLFFNVVPCLDQVSGRLARRGRGGQRESAAPPDARAGRAGAGVARHRRRPARRPVPPTRDHPAARARLHRHPQTVLRSYQVLEFAISWPFCMLLRCSIE